MRMAQGRLAVETRGQGLYEVTAEAASWVAAQTISTGLLTLFLRHSSASLLIQENAAPEMREDLLDFLRDLAPENAARWRHDDEGPDDMPAHVKSALLPTQLAVPVADARLLLGTWQGIYVVEHRRAPHRRELVLHLAGE
ncbi:MAG: secondary thiamine-phosphate synthase enzyme YjbQ [Stellaceae bacterium]|jgi:secondary thiamine-phosphate synthase enzyme